MRPLPASSPHRLAVFSLSFHFPNACLFATFTSHFLVLQISFIGYFFSSDNRELLGEMEGIDVLLQQLSVRLSPWLDNLVALTSLLAPFEPVSPPAFPLRCSNVTIRPRPRSRRWWRTSSTACAPASCCQPIGTASSKGRGFSSWI